MRRYTGSSLSLGYARHLFPGPLFLAVLTGITRCCEETTRGAFKKTYKIKAADGKSIYIYLEKSGWEGSVNICPPKLLRR